MEQIGRYRILEEIARGGMGVVYRARHEGLPREVAIKVLLAAGDATEHQRRRFLREAKLISRLSHPGIVRVEAVGEEEGRLYMVLDFVDGQSLQEVIDTQGPLSVGRALAITRKLADALTCAHEAGILHRDLKPANVLLDRDGEPRLTDFGLAKDLSPSTTQALSVTGRFMGTPGYLPPEQARGQLDLLGPHSDVYGLGAILYAMLTGRPPHGEPESLLAAMAMLDCEPEPPSRSSPAVDRDLDAVVLRCLAVDPKDRFASMQALVKALDGEVHTSVAWRVPVALLVALALVGVGSWAAVGFSRPTERSRGSEEGAQGGPQPEVLPQVRPSTGESVSPTPTVNREAEEAFERAKGAHIAGRFREAIAGYREAIRLDPNHDRAYSNRGAARLSLGDPQGALADYNEAIQLQPNNARARNNRGGLLDQLGDLPGAIADYTEAIRLQPDFAPPYFNRSLSRVKLGDHAGAIGDCDEALRLDPANAEAFCCRGEARHELGDVQGAIDDWERALDLEPSATWAARVRKNTRVARQRLAEGRPAD